MSIQKWSFGSSSVSCSKFNPRNINHMPVVKLFAFLDLEQKSVFLNGHWQLVRILTKRGLYNYFLIPMKLVLNLFEERGSSNYE